MKTSTSKSSVISQILFSLVAIAIGYLLLFNKSVQVVTLCQLMCGGLVVVGIASIVSFFVSGDYKRIDRYGFALGAMLVLMGCIGFLRMDDLTTHFEFYTGFMSLILGALVLQGTVQIKVLNYAAWILNLVLSIVCLAGAFFILAKITAVTQLVAGFSSWVLLICGATCLLSMFMTWICIQLAARRDKKIAAEKEAEAQREAEAKKEAELQAQKEAEALKAQQAAEIEKARQEAQAEARREAEMLAQQTQQNQQAQQEPAPVPPQPAETHHGGFDTAADPQSDLPPMESPELVFGNEGNKPAE